MNIIQTIWNILFLVYQCNGMPRFANYLQDHMVLQRAPQKAVVWGFSNPSTITTLVIDGKTYTTISEITTNTQNESIWSVTLDPVSDEGPFDIHVSQPTTSGNVTITLHDVVFGDVWFCSGQSNMQLTVGMIYNGTIEISNAGNFPKIRVFSASRHISTSPLEELEGIDLNWSVASPQSIGGPDWIYMSAVCWLYGRMIHQALDGRPIGLIASSWGGTMIELWMPPKALAECNVTITEKKEIEAYNEIPTSGLSFQNSDLFNAMMYPFTRMVIYGVIWYQGEANAHGNGTDTYACTFAKMIESWRQIWNTRTNGSTNIDFPFGFVQLSTYSNTSALVGYKPIIRWHQTFDIGYVPNNIVPNVFMAVALDLRDDPNGVHPRYKHDVGYRLSRSGLAIAYDQKVEFQGPIVDKVTYESGGSTINITYRAVSSIEWRNPNGFEVCCQQNKCVNDNDYSWISSIVTNKNDLTITIAVNSSCIGKQLYGVRYLWRDTPCLFKQAAVYSGTDSNLPSPPYIKLFSNKSNHNTKYLFS